MSLMVPTTWVWRVNAPDENAHLPAAGSCVPGIPPASVATVASAPVPARQAHSKLIEDSSHLSAEAESLRDVSVTAGMEIDFTTPDVSVMYQIIATPDAGPIATFVMVDRNVGSNEVNFADPVILPGPSAFASGARMLPWSGMSDDDWSSDTSWSVPTITSL